jgi:hypothetical protein
VNHRTQPLLTAQLFAQFPSPYLGIEKLFLLGEPLGLFAEIFLGRIFREPLPRPMRRGHDKPFPYVPGVR